MAYSLEVVRRARQQLQQDNQDKKTRYNQALQKAYIECPRLQEIDYSLRRSMSLAAQMAFQSGSMDALEEVKKANLALQAERGVLIATQYPELAEEPLCPYCGGEGYIGTQMCSCLKDYCQSQQLAEISRLCAGNESFAAFRLDYYPEKVDSRYGIAPRALMERNFAIAQQYAASFDGQDNLLFVGGTGLGKTFLSACIARSVAQKGFSVAYESAPQLFAALEKDRFSPDETSAQASQRFRSCDLLIIDDLGTEMPSSFVTAALYSLLNDRLLEKKAMLISTNLTIAEIAQRYSPQIASRLQGQFRGLTFIGEDIRVKKGKR